MNVLVMGSRGFIGSHAVRYFARAGYLVRGADVIGASADGYAVLDADRSDFATLILETGPDLCINASGAAEVVDSFAHPERDYALNVVNVQRILSAIARHCPDCRLVNLSSAAVYGNPKTLPVPEEAPTVPMSPYGTHKLQSELLLHEYARLFGLRTCSIRIFSAFGPGLRKQLFWDVYRMARDEGRVELFGTGAESRDFIFVEDICRAIEAIARRGRFEGEVLNVACGREISVREAVGRFLEAYDPSIPFAFSGAARKGDPANWCADVSRLKALGFEPAYSFEAGIREVVKWLRESE